jgi:hypothetical protein
MSNTNTGGPAFPSGLQQQANDILDSLHKGMTLRDYFAAKAMGDVLVSKHIVTMKYSELAVGAYKIADAMLEARKA